jgi:hypothetical protein
MKRLGVFDGMFTGQCAGTVYSIGTHSESECECECHSERTATERAS